jgi:hypothetical protein
MIRIAPRAFSATKGDTMISTKLATLSLAAALAAILPTIPAQAEVAVAFISSTGSDANGCFATEPCGTLAGAYAQLGPGGTIVCLDSFQIFNGVTLLNITHSLTIDCRGVYLGLVSSGDDILTVNAGPTDVVILRGLAFESIELGAFTPAFTGIKLVSGGALHIENCTFRNFSTAGIELAPTNAAKLYVANSTMQHSGSGVLINPSSGGSVAASFDHVAITENTGGGLKTETTTSGPVTVDISNSTISYNAGNGMNAVSGAGGANMLNLIHDVIASNGNAGVQANGSNAAALIDTTLLDSNVAGATASVASGRLLTYGNNHIVGSAGSGFTGTAPSQ